MNKYSQQKQFTLYWIPVQLLSLYVELIGMRVNWDMKIIFQWPALYLQTNNTEHGPVSDLFLTSMITHAQ